MARKTTDEKKEEIKIPSFKLSLKCKNQKQKELVNSIKNNQITICKGIFGTGKSYVIGATVLNLLKATNDFEKIICITPTVEVGDMHIGLMPGNLEEKMNFHIINEIDCFLKILKDSNNIKPENIIKQLMSNNIIEFRPISNLRGASFRNSLILVSEAEEFTKEELFLILSRFESGKIIISGDPLQSSRTCVKKGNSGLLHACDKLKSIDKVGIVVFSNEDIVRNDILHTIYLKWMN